MANHPNADEKDVSRDQRLIGLGVSRGVGKGNVVFLPPRSKSDFRGYLTEKDVEEEIRRFRSAVESSEQQLRELAAASETPVSEIFSFHLLILESSFVDKTESLIKEKKVNAEFAVDSVIGEFSAKQSSLAAEHFRDKYLDIEDVASRLKRAMRGPRTPISLEPNAVVVAREFRPSAVIELAKHKPAGLITEIGGWTSHMSIVAREFHVPMVTGIKNAEKVLSSGDLVIVDGNSGEVFLDPDGHSPRVEFRGSKNIPIAEVTTPSCVRTTDGVEIMIRANAEDPNTYRTAEVFGARGVGLYRSELLIKEDGVLPDEDAQASAYAEMARATRELGVAIRTFDISPEQVAFHDKDGQRNPALGLRAIRSGLAEPGLFKTQLRAILRASSAGKVDIVLPMVSNLEDIQRSKAIISSIVLEMRLEGVEVKEPRVGVMMEVPSTVFAAARIAKQVDFLCLGTNDLVQYLLAADRDNDAVADWYQSLNPSVLSAIKLVLDASAEAGIPTTVCGEMAGSPFYVPVLIGLGAREFSLNSNSIRPVTHLLSGISAKDAAELVKSLGPCETAAEAEELLRDHYQTNWSQLFPPGLISSKHR